MCKKNKDGMREKEKKKNRLCRRDIDQSNKQNTKEYIL